METLEIVEGLTCLKEQADYKGLYLNTFPCIAKFISKRGGTLQDAKDIFQDALVIFLEKTQDADFCISTCEGYLLGISKHLWIRKFEKERNHVTIDEYEAAISLPEDYFPKVEERRLLSVLERTGKKCLDLLRSFYYEKLGTQDLLDKFGYQNAHSAAVQKYKCLEKVRETVKQKMLVYEDFME